MKKVISIVMALTVCLMLMLPMTVSAAAASAALSGPATVRAGDSITLTFKLSGSKLSGVSGTLSYDKSQLTLSGTKQKISSPWAVEFNGNNMVAYDNELSSPINSQKTLFTVTFKVKSSVAAGTNITVSYTNVIASDGSADANIGTVSYRATVAAPLSANNELGTLTLGNATLSPAFAPGITGYTADVPFEVAKLQVNATAADSKATVKIQNPTLKADGTTSVVITVTAENGSKKTYTIKVHRAKDPNYVPSANNALSDITVNGFVLSPVFNKNVTEYMVWLPYETAKVTVSGKAADSKATVKVEGGNNLAAGQDNPVKVICTAENGEQKVYTVIVKRAAAHDGSVDAKPTESTTATTTTATTTATSATTDDIPTDEAPNESGFPLWLLIVVGVLGLGIGFSIGFVVKKS